MKTTGTYSGRRMTLSITNEKKATFTVKGGAPQEGTIPGRLFGNFLEHLGIATQGGILAQALNNPALTMDDNLSEHTRLALLRNGQTLEEIARLGEERAQGVYGSWRPAERGSGFSAAVLDDMRAQGLPFPWKASPAPLATGGQKGRIGHSVRLTPLHCEVTLSQGVFLPQHRVLAYEGSLWARSNGDVNLCVRIAKRDGQVLCEQALENPAGCWRKLAFALTLPLGALAKGEPVDFQIAAQGSGELLVDRACLTPTDHIGGFDPEMLALTRRYAPPILRGPGGNFVSGYHFWHGIGDVDLRQTFKNPAWPGIETNFFGIDEFLRLCELIGSEPHITVNLGDGIPEEAAAWVEYVNGPASSHWGAKRAANGRPEPWGVKVWEVGNEIYGEWQIGHCGDCENARRYRETAAAMLAVDPTITLIGNGSEFDFYGTDMTWNRVLMQEGGETLRRLALHALPGNAGYTPPMPAQDVWRALQAQPFRWESVDLPNLFDDAKRLGIDLEVAITEWGILGAEPFRPSVANSGDSVYGAGFYNMCLRLKERVFETNATALYHGGCIRKAGVWCYADPQMEIIRRYTELTDGVLYAMRYEGPAYDVARGLRAVPATGEVPVLDAVCARRADGTLAVAVVNRHPDEDIPVELILEDMPFARAIRCEAQQGVGMNDINTPLEPQRVGWKALPFRVAGAALTFIAPARGVIWIEMDG